MSSAPACRQICRRSNSRATRGIPVWSEIELAWRFLRGKLVAITGSNGKTTTTSLVAHILKTADIPTLVGGNIGVPLLALVEAFDRPIRHGRGDQQFSARDDRRIPAGNRRAAESDAGSSRPPRHVRGIRARQDAHVRKSTRARCRCAERGRSRNHATACPRSRTFSGSAGRSAWPQGRSCATTKLFFARKARKCRSRDAMKFLCAANTTSKTCWPPAPPRIWRAPTPAAIANGVKSFRGVEHRLEFVAEIGGV